MSHAEENDGWEGPVLDRGEGKKAMFKLSPKFASELPEGSIPPADLQWPDSASSQLPVCKLMPPCRFGQALQVNECGELGAWASFWGNFKCSSSFSHFEGVQPACPGPPLYVLVLLGGTSLSGRWAPCRLQGIAAMPQVRLLAPWAQCGAGGMRRSDTLAEWGSLGSQKRAEISLLWVMCKAKMQQQGDKVSVWHWGRLDFTWGAKVVLGSVSCTSVVGSHGLVSLPCPAWWPWRG